MEGYGCGFQSRDHANIQTESNGRISTCSATTWPYGELAGHVALHQNAHRVCEEPHSMTTTGSLTWSGSEPSCTHTQLNTQLSCGEEAEYHAIPEKGGGCLDKDQENRYYKYSALTLMVVGVTTVCLAEESPNRKHCLPTKGT